ncbi:MAG: S8 family peptidase, partial [Candidatus Binatia bacterium]
MVKKRFCLFGARTAMALAFIVTFTGLSQGEVGHGPDLDPIVPGQFIVVVNEGFDPAQVAADHAAVPLHVYRFAARGFAARLSQGQVNALLADPRINNVVADRRVTTTNHSPGHGKNFGGGGTSETTPTGVSRIDAELANSAGGTIAAILDTGIDLDHPDLTLSTTCSFNAFSGPPDDGNGHGTHVAGTVAAKAGNNLGVRGVAPGATLCPVKVLDDSGSGTWATVIAGIDYVTGRRMELNNGSGDGDPGINIKVANMSLGGCANVFFIWCLAEPPPGNNNCGLDVDGVKVLDPLHQSVCKSTRAGVVYVVAAGNSSADAVYFVPAAFPEVITVSAVADYNGRGGGGAKAPRGCDYGPDDFFASFSNFGEVVDIAAPGTCILSTYKGGGTKTMSGTSMATPHVTGAAALASFDVAVGDKNSP